MTRKAALFLKDHWVAVLAALTMAAGWGTNTALVGMQGRDIEKISTNVVSIMVDVGTIKGGAPATTASIEDLRSRVQRLEARR